MKVIKNDEFNIEIFLGKDVLNCDLKDELEKYLKKVFNRLNNYYDILIKGFYDVGIYIDKNYGMILDITKDDIDFEPLFNSVDMKITIHENDFLYKFDDYKYENLGDIYYYKNAYYLDILDIIEDKTMMKLMEEAIINYKDINYIKKKGYKINKNNQLL